MTDTRSAANDLSGDPVSGKVAGIARRSARRADMEAVDAATVSVERGIEGDYAGSRRNRQVTLLAAEDWAAAVSDAGIPSTPWTARRANVLVAGVRLPRARGAIIQVGSVVLAVTGETNPCKRMDEVADGLRKALSPEWRGGVTCAVRHGGKITLGDAVRILDSPPERSVRMPG